jgi:hypothetical protein
LENFTSILYGKFETFIILDLETSMAKIMLKWK